VTSDDDKAAGRPPTLHRVLYRVHLSVAATAVTLAGSSLLFGGLIALHFYAESNLHLVARSISYTVEAAVVFNDRAAAEETLRMIATTESVSQAEVADRDGHIVASWKHPESGLLSALKRQVAIMVLRLPFSEPIIHDGAPIGEVRVWGGGTVLLRFLLVELIGGLGCLALSMLIAVRLSRRMLHGIVGPLQSLARAAHEVRQQRNFTRRVSPAPIAELNDFGDDFNALLDELESWQALMQHENARLMHEATHDKLTGLPNRGLFEARLNRAVAEASTTESSIAVLFLDSDHFKTINDSFGHAAGDAMLVGIATRLRTHLRSTDLVARLGGDEFAILLAPVGDQDDAVRIANSIIASQRPPIALPDGIQITTTLSIGIALFPTHARDAQSLLQAADVAMYETKRERRGGWKLTNSHGTPRAVPELDM
jgi:diguanylate cyclase